LSKGAQKTEFRAQILQITFHLAIFSLWLACPFSLQDFSQCGDKEAELFREGKTTFIAKHKRTVIKLG
jgi:hypothetical protein